MSSLRDELRDVLRLRENEKIDVYELSRLVGRPAEQVIFAALHLDKQLRSEGKGRIQIIDPVCRDCGRRIPLKVKLEKLSPIPSKCPFCGSTRLDGPRIIYKSK